MTRRPLTSRVSLLAPLNIVSWAWRPTLSHNFPPGTTIWIAETHCQRLMVKKTRTDSDLGHISEVAAVSGDRVCFESTCWETKVQSDAGAYCRDLRRNSAITPLKRNSLCVSPNSVCFGRLFLILTGALATGYRTGCPHPVNPRAPRGGKESAGKPGSVVDNHSSGMRVAAQL